MIYVVGTRKFAWCIHPFAAMVEKYWGEPVVWYGDYCDVDLPGNAEFRVVPDHEDDWDWDWTFGEGLQAVLEDIGEDVVFLCLLDHWLCKPVNVRGIAELRYYMEWNKNILRANVTDDECFLKKGKQKRIHVCWRDGFQILTIPPADLHCGFYGGLTFTPALWNTKLLHEILEPQWNLWQCEFHGTEKMIDRYPKVKSVGVRPHLLQFNHALRHMHRGKVILNGLNEEDREMIREMIPRDHICSC